MTTFYDVDELERHNSHLVGEVKDAKRMFKWLTETHKKSNGGRDCTCQLCVDVRAWLARNKQA